MCRQTDSQPFVYSIAFLGGVRHHHDAAIVCKATLVSDQYYYEYSTSTFASGGSSCNEEMFGNVLDIPAFATAFKNAGVDVSLWKATAQIGDLFQLSKKNTKYSGIDFDYDLRGPAV